MIGDGELTAHGLGVGLYRTPTSRHALDPEAATITLDESWSPYGQAELVCQSVYLTPLGVTSDLSAIDPSTVNYRVALDMTQSFGEDGIVASITGRFDGDTIADMSAAFGGKPVSAITEAFAWHPWNQVTPSRVRTRTIEMLLRSRRIDAEAGTTTLGLATWDALLHDHAHVSKDVPELIAPSTISTVVGAVNWVLGYIVESLDDYTGASGIPFDRDANPWRTGQSAWDYISPIVQQADLRLWCDESRVWRLRSASLTPADTAAFSTSKTVTKLVDTIDNDSEVYDSVLITYQWTDSAGEPHIEYDAAQSGSTSRRPFLVTYDRPYPGAGGAARILAQLLKRRRQVPIAAVTDNRVRPGMNVTIASSGPLLTGVVRSVTFNYPADEMDIATRDVQVA